MDKKQDRQFYWEVKDFMSSKKKINENNQRTVVILTPLIPFVKH